MKERSQQSTYPTLVNGQKLFVNINLQRNQPRVGISGYKWAYRHNFPEITDLHTYAIHINKEAQHIETDRTTYTGEGVPPLNHRQKTAQITISPIKNG